MAREFVVKLIPSNTLYSSLPSKSSAFVPQFLMRSSGDSRSRLHALIDTVGDLPIQSVVARFRQ